MTTIDLHGVRYKDVYGILERACMDDDTPFVVITGESTRMKKIVTEIVRQFGLVMQEKLGNHGRVIIYQKNT